MATCPLFTILILSLFLTRGSQDFPEVIKTSVCGSLSSGNLPKVIDTSLSGLMASLYEPAAAGESGFIPCIAKVMWDRSNLLKKSTPPVVFPQVGSTGLQTLALSSQYSGQAWRISATK